MEMDTTRKFNDDIIINRQARAVLECKPVIHYKIMNEQARLRAASMILF